MIWKFIAVESTRAEGKKIEYRVVPRIVSISTRYVMKVMYVAS